MIEMSSSACFDVGLKFKIAFNFYYITIIYLFFGTIDKIQIDSE